MGCESIYQIHQTACIKLVLHSLKHKTSAVNAVPLGRVFGPGGDSVEIVDSVPLFHAQIGLLPPLEISLIMDIELEAHAVKGLGKTRAKWSPVSTAWYRMLPEIILLEEIEGLEAEKLVKKCPVNVFDIEDIGQITLESAGALPPQVLFTEAAKVLEDKCERVSAEHS